MGLQAACFQCLQDIAGDNAAVRYGVQATLCFVDALGCLFGLHEIVGMGFDGLLLPVVLCRWRVTQFVQKLPFEMAQRGEMVLSCAEVPHKLCQGVVKVGMRVFTGGELEQDFVGV